MDEDLGQNVVELDADSWILVEIERQWPKYVATWSIRRRAGDSDYPLQSGTIERMPPGDPSGLDAMLDGLRQEAVEAATAAASQGSQEGAKKKGGLLGRLLGRG